MHVKEKAGLIICNGPSLEDIPVEFLMKYKSIGMNRITGMYPEFAPTYYVDIAINHMETPEKRALLDPYFEDERVEAMFLNRLMIHHFRHEKVYSIMSRQGGAVDRTTKKAWSDDPLNFLGIGYTQTYIALQIADYMGFRNILIVGLDHHYPEGSKKHWYEDSDFPDFETGYGPYTEAAWKNGCNLVYSLANEQANGTIINLTPGSACDVFKKENLSKW
jgi:hypothetical protein